MINWDRISELREEVGEDDLAEVLGLFFEEVEEVLEKLPSADAQDIPGHLHFLKGSALNIGLSGVSGLCRDEEAKLAADPTANAQVGAIRSAYNAAKIELESLF